MSGDDSETSLSLQLVNLLKNGINPQTQTLKLLDNLQINLKLNNQNYALWTQMIQVVIGGKSKALLSHLTSDPPSQDNESYEQWEQEDLIVFSWLIQNIEPTIAGNLTEFSRIMLGIVGGGGGASPDVLIVAMVEGVIIDVGGSRDTIWEDVVVKIDSTPTSLSGFNMLETNDEIEELSCGSLGLTGVRIT
nr:putative Gag-polypeptide of LTR copia-type [Tanacetum cinerariifolium]